MRRTVIALALALLAGVAIALSPTPDANVPTEPYLLGLNADQRAAWYAHSRALAAEQERNELRDERKAMQRRIEKLQSRYECT